MISDTKYSKFKHKYLLVDIVKVIKRTIRFSNLFIFLISITSDLYFLVFGSIIYYHIRF